MLFVYEIMCLVWFGRPFSNDELKNNAPQVVTCNDYQREVAVSQAIAGKQIDRVFTFDKVPYFTPIMVILIKALLI